MRATTEHSRRTLESPKHHIRCTRCGYGAIARTLPTACPMCRSSSWERQAWRPFGHLRDVWDRDGEGPTAAA